jgi:hypothetical protein
MIEQKINWTFPYWGAFLFKSKISKESLEKILKQANKKVRYNKNLAGHIDGEFVFPSDILNKHLTPYFNAYIQGASKFYNEKTFRNKYIEMTGKAWINYMKAGDFNPPHHHSDDFSFVLYLKIPKTLRKEHEKYNGTSTGPGAIEFQLGDYRPFSNSSAYYFPEEGDIFIFPANLNHFVYPFKSKGDRISVSANLLLKDKTK